MTDNIKPGDSLPAIIYTIKSRTLAFMDPINPPLTMYSRISLEEFKIGIANGTYTDQNGTFEPIEEGETRPKRTRTRIVGYFTTELHTCPPKTDAVLWCYYARSKPKWDAMKKQIEDLLKEQHGN